MATTTSAIRTETVGRVRVITIDRPAVRNAVDGPTAAALAGAFRAFDVDDQLDVAVLCGASGTFCAGADLSAVHDPTNGRMNRVEEEGDGPMGPTRLQLTKPVIAAIDGYAVAGGLELACWCDLRVVEESAVLGVFCRRVGVPLIDGGTIRLPRLIGLSRALDLILTGRPVDAREALAIGLANRVVPAGCARAEAIALAQALSALPQACLRADRAATFALHDLPLDEALRAELRGGRAVLAAAAPTVAAFLAGQGRHGAPLR
jgi:enoyl-CoA hydratase